MDQYKHAIDGDDASFCRVFGYYTGYSEGPVRTLECGFIGCTTSYQHAELLVRKEHYPYEFYVIEYDLEHHRVSRYFDERKSPTFRTQKELPARKESPTPKEVPARELVHA